jgi:hypothetical protein
LGASFSGGEEASWAASAGPGARQAAARKREKAVFMKH